MQIMKKSLQEALASLKRASMDELLEKRFERLLAYGKFRAND